MEPVGLQIADLSFHLQSAICNLKSEGPWLAWGGRVPMARMLTEDQAGRYARDGLVFPVRILAAEEAHRYRLACDELEAHLGGKPRTVEVRQMHLHFPWAHELATHPRVLDAVEDLLGPDLLIWATELFAKHPRDAAVSIGWHRDRPYMGFAGETVPAWVALSDSTPANGCLRAVPGPARPIADWRLQIADGKTNLQSAISNLQSGD